jgi:hypothetical protein
VFEFKNRDRKLLRSSAIGTPIRKPYANRSLKIRRSGFENRKLIDSFQQAIELRHLRGIKLMLNISEQELVQPRLSRRRQQTLRQCFQLAGAQANQDFGIIVNRDISGDHNRL